jgi:hypothetical protein
MLQKLPNSQLKSVYYKQSHIPTVKVNTKLTTISAQGKMRRQPSSQPRDINIEILVSLSYNKQHIGVVTKSS